MSRWWPETLVVSLQPHLLAWLGPGGERGRLVTPLAEDPSAARWHAVLELLRAQCASWLRERLRVRVILSNCFVRYGVLPPHAGSPSPADALALARHGFARTHGEASRDWAVRVSDGLAAGLDCALLAALRACFQEHARTRLVAIEPYLMSAYNRWRRQVPREGACLALAEPRRVCVAARGPAGWCAVYNAAEIAPPRTGWSVLLEREQQRAARPLPPLLLARASSAADLLPLDDAPETRAWARHG